MLKMPFGAAQFGAAQFASAKPAAPAAPAEQPSSSSSSGSSSSSASQNPYAAQRASQRDEFLQAGVRRSIDVLHNLSIYELDEWS